LPISGEVAARAGASMLLLKSLRRHRPLHRLVRRRRAFYCHRRRTNAPSGTSTREGGPPNVHTKTLVGDADSCSVSSRRRC
jgi:hypothetical protein